MYRIIYFIILILVASPNTALTKGSDTMDSIKITSEVPADFDFLIGEWRITNKIRKERLSENNEWTESVAYSRCWQILDGLGNMDEFEMKSRGGRIFKGHTIRVYSPSRKDWTLYWVDSWNPDLGVTKQTVGSFDSEVGVFYGEEEFNGKTVRLKFTWKKLDENQAYWDQAYYDEKNKEWEINWIMIFDRISE